VAIGRAIVRNPQLFLFDERCPTLTPVARRDARRDQAPPPGDRDDQIYVTHDQIEAMTLADRIVLMRDGVIEQQGAPLELFERPATRFVAGFLGSPKMNFLPGRLARDGSGAAIRLDGDRTALPLPAGRGGNGAGDGAAVILGLRPEHITRGTGSAPAQGCVRLQTEIELLQPTGSRTYVTFRLGERPVVAELQAHDVRPGRRADIARSQPRSRRHLRRSYRTGRFSPAPAPSAYRLRYARVRNRARRHVDDRRGDLVAADRRGLDRIGEVLVVVADEARSMHGQAARESLAEDAVVEERQPGIGHELHVRSGKRGW
jgi:hypothetical protein